ncbi:MAG: mandelate racemase/muconate lactonizing enzyme family protein [Acidimicrobiales bacterium]
MKIEVVECFDYLLGYVHGEYVMSGGRAATTQVGTLVSIRTDEGVEGWGEITTLGATYLPAHADGVRAALHLLGPHILGCDPTNTSALWRVMDSALLDNPYAKSAIDIACWDIKGKVLGEPIAVLLGGVQQVDFPIYEAVPLGAPDEMAGFVERRSSAGINRFQLKVGNEPSLDVARTKAAVTAAQDDAIVIADANGGWSLLEARQAIRAMADLPVLIEQPCRTTSDCAQVVRHSALPLVLDESVVSIPDVFEAKYAACASSINIKLSRVGGITKAAQMRDVMQNLNLSVSVEDMWGGDVITAAVSHLAASTRPESLLMTSFFNDWTDGHIAGYQPRSVGGRGAAPSGPGLGIDVDPSSLRRVFSVSDRTLTSAAIS